MRDVVIFGGAIGSVLALSRELYEKFNTRIYVICLNNPNGYFYLASKSIIEVFEVNVIDDQDFFDKIKFWFSKKIFSEKPIVYFASDYACLQVIKYRKWFEDNSVLCLPNNHIVEVFNNKGKAEVVAANSGLLVPKSKILSCEIDVSLVLKDFSFPIIVKPRDSESGKKLNFKVLVFQDKESFLRQMNELLSMGDSLLCQEFIPGGDENSYFYLFYRGTKDVVYDNIGVKTMQSPRGHGIMAKGQLVDNEELQVICREFLSNIDYKGIGGIEFKKYNGKYYFIEMSTRMEGFFLISSKSNVSLGEISYKDYNHLGLPLVQRVKSVFYVDLHLIVRTYILERKYFTALKEIVMAFSNNKYCINIYSIKDIKPFVRYCKKFFLK